MRALLLTLALLVVAAPAAANTLSYTVDWEDNGVPFATGNAYLDFVTEGPGVEAVAGVSDLDQLPVTQMAWVAELLMANTWHRWTSPDVTPPPQGASTVSGNFDLNFGAAGFLQAQVTLDFQNQTGTLLVQTFNWVGGILYEPEQPFWASIHEDIYGGGGGGEYDSDGCVIVNDRQVATLQGQVTLTPSQSLGALPQSTVSTSLLVSAFDDDAQFDGKVFVTEDEAWVVQIFVDDGQGYSLEGGGMLTVEGVPDPQRSTISGDLDVSQSNYSNLLVLVDLTVLPLLHRVYYPQTPWPGGQPQILQGAQVVDLGLAGILGVEVYLDNDVSLQQGTRVFQIGLDVTQMAPITGPGQAWTIHSVESFDGQPNGALDGTGSVYSGGSVVGTWTGNYTTNPAIDTEAQATTLVDLTVDHTDTFGIGQALLDGRGRTDTARSASVATTLLADGQVFQGAGSLSLVPLEVDDPNAAETPNRFSVSGSIGFDGPLPSRALFLSQLPALQGWLRQVASLPQTPPLGAGLLTGDVLLDYGTGYGTALYDIDPDLDTIQYDTDLDQLDLVGLLPLPPKFWVNLGSSSEDDEGEQVEVEHQCIEICEEDPQTEEVICTAFCQVRARVRRETYPDKTGGDPFLELLGNLLLCVEFSPDDQTVTFTGEFLLEPGPTDTAAPGPGTRFHFAPPYPNPSPGSTTFSLRLPGTLDVTLDLYDARGRRVRRVHAGELPAGSHVLGWDGQDDAGRPVASGVYWARVRAGSDLSVRRLLVVR